MSVVVLGGRGFLGRHVAEALADAGAEVEVGPPSEELDLRVAAPADVAARLRGLGASTVVNATGQISGSLSELIWGNAEVARRLVDACRQVRPGLRLVHLGSAAEYGVTPSWVPVDEGQVENPAAPYGTAKLMATRALLEATEAGDVDAVVLRVFNPLGRGQSPMTLPGAVAAQLVADPDGDVHVGPLHPLRDFVTARDIGRAAAAAALAELPAWVGSPRDARIVNVGSGTARPVRDVVRLLRERAGHRGRLVERESGGSERSRAVDGAPADVARAARLLAWQPLDTLDDAVDEVLAGAVARAGAVASKR
jgi:nucleoside-diphosphate-sugar epimerase